MIKPNRKPTTPGEIMKAHFLEPRHVTITALAEASGCSRSQLGRIVRGEGRIDALTATRIARVLNTTPEFWLNLQNAIDLYEADRQLQTWKPDDVFADAV